MSPNNQQESWAWPQMCWNIEVYTGPLSQEPPMQAKWTSFTGVREEWRVRISYVEWGVAVSLSAGFPFYTHSHPSADK